MQQNLPFTNFQYRYSLQLIADLILLTSSESFFNYPSKGTYYYTLQTSPYTQTKFGQAS